MIPVGARVGLGALAAALLAAGGIAGVTGVVALVAAATIGVAGLRLDERHAARGRAATALVVGAWLLSARLLLGGGVGAEAPGHLPGGTGPWTGRVTALGTPREGMQRFTLALDAAGNTPGASDGGDQPRALTADAAATGPLLLAVTAPRYPTVEPGGFVRLDGKLEPPPEDGYGDFLRRSGISGSLRSAGLALVGRAGDPAAVLERLRRGADDALARALPEPAAGLAAGILIGLRDRVDRDLAAAFTATGLSHVVAISGWNIAIVAGLVGSLLAGRARRTRSAAILVAIVCYTLLAGASPSVVRAAAMAGVALLARESGRPGTAAAALGWAVALLVLAVPANALDIGLQLSAAATAGLIAWSSPLTAAIERRAPRLPGWVREGLGVSLAAQAATLPIVLLAFGRVAPLSPLTNLAVVPLVPLAMAGGALALAGGFIVSLGAPAMVATLAGLPGALVLGLLIAIVRFAATLPLASLTLPPPAGALAAAGAAAGLAAFLFRQRRGTEASRASPSKAEVGRRPAPVSATARHSVARPCGRSARRALRSGPAGRRGDAAGRARPCHCPRRGPGRCDPRDRPDRAPDARRRRSGPRAAPGRARRSHAALGPPD